MAYSATGDSPIAPESPQTIRVLRADDHALVRAGARQSLEFGRDIQIVAEAEDGAICESAA